MGLTLRKAGSKLGYNITDDPEKKIAGVQNPQTGKNISFGYGQGTPYGIGRFEPQGVHYVTDLGLFMKSLGGDIYNVNPPTPQQIAQQSVPQQIQQPSQQPIQQQAQQPIQQPIQQQAQQQVQQPVSPNYPTGVSSDMIPQYQPQYRQQALGMLNNLPQYTPKYREEALGYLRGINPYQERYGQQIEGALAKTNQQFQYDPTQDKYLRMAQQDAQEQAMAEMQRRGILSSTMTADRASQATAKLEPEFYEKAYGRHQFDVNKAFQQAGAYQSLEQDNFRRYQTDVENKLNQAEFLNRLDVQDLQQYVTDMGNAFNQIDVLNSFDNQDLQRYQMNLDTMFKQVQSNVQNELLQLDKQKQAWDKALEKTEWLGYVDKESAIALGVEPGTLSKDIRDRAAQLEDYTQKLGIELQSKLQENEALFQQGMSQSNVVNEPMAQAVQQLMGMSQKEQMKFLQNPKNLANIPAEQKVNLLSSFFEKQQIDKQANLQAEQIFEANKYMTDFQNLSFDESMQKINTTTTTRELVEKFGIEGMQFILQDINGKKLEEASRHAGALMSRLMGMPPDEALNDLSQNGDVYSKYVGVDTLKGIIDMVQESKETGDKLALDSWYKQQQVELDYAKAAEAQRHNVATEAETQRHHGQTEAASWANVETSRINAETARAKVDQAVAGNNKEAKIKEYTRLIEEQYMADEYTQGADYEEQRKTGRQYMSEKDKDSISIFIESLINAGEDIGVIDELAKKFNIEPISTAKFPQQYDYYKNK